MKTPRTDEQRSLLAADKDGACHYWVKRDFARQLEQELSETKAAKVELEAQIGEFQTRAKELIDKMTGSNVDGGGCDSGDWRDFTLSEISQGISHVIDKLKAESKGVCEWRRLHSAFVRHQSSCSAVYNNIEGNFCPGCGKEIKVV